MAKASAAMRELAKRIELEKAPKFTLEKFCFNKQLEFLTGPGRFKVACTSTRAGKSNAIIAHMIKTCITERDVVVAYFTISANSARNIIWGELKRLLEDYSIPCNINETTMRVKFTETRSEIRVNGANNEVEIEKVRGWKLRAAYVDELQSFKSYIKYFIESILVSRLRDQAGFLFLTGTPGPIPAGYFYDLLHQQNSWGKYHWTCFDNPYMLNLEQTLAEERAAAGITEEEPAYQREVYGRWVLDTNSMVFKFDAERNVYKEAPKNLEYVMAADIGYSDSDAIAVLGYNTTGVYLIEEEITAKQDISELAAKIKILDEKYKPVKKVMDAGALGKKIQAELLQRHGLLLESAEKERKFEFIELMNDDLRTGKFKAMANSKFEEDCKMVVWETVGNRREISTRYHSDIGDAVLYAWKNCKHYYPATPEIPKIELRSEEEIRELEARDAAEVDAAKRGDDGFGVDQDDLLAVFDVGDDYY